MAQARKRRNLAKLNPFNKALSWLKQEKVKVSRKKVTFVGVTETHYTLNIDDYTDEEFFSTWFHPAERITMLSRLSKSVTKFEGGNCDACCGLERMTEEGMRSRQLNTWKAYEVVLGIQQAQWEEGIDDPKLIATLYHKISRPCLKEAQLRANQQQDEARSYWNARYKRIGVTKDGKTNTPRLIQNSISAEKCESQDALDAPGEKGGGSMVCVVSNSPKHTLRACAA